MLVDGQSHDTIPASDRGLAYGDGLFETIAVVDGRPLAFDAHLARLARGAAHLGLAAPELPLLQRETTRVIGDCEQGVIRITLTRGSGGRGYRPDSTTQQTRRIVSLHPWPDTGAWSAGRAWLCKQPLSINPALAGIKHLNRLDQVLASREWPGEGYLEGLMCDADGHLVEGTRSNLFLVIDNRLVTPRLARAGVAGIVRDAVIAVRDAAGEPVQIRDVRTDELAVADEIFVCNSVFGIRALFDIDGVARTTPLTAKISSALARALSAAGTIA